MTAPRDSARRPGRAACWLGVLIALGTFGLAAAVLTPAHLLLRRRPATAFAATRLFHGLVCRALKVRLTAKGAPVAPGPVLYVANHISWLDIFVLGSRLPAAFVAKSEVSDWPLVGWLARLQPTLFVVRADRRGARAQAQALADTLQKHGAAILFAEGTSSDGAGVGTFKSTLFAALFETPGLRIQPLTIVYTSLSGRPVTDANRARVAWYGDMTLPPHLFALAGETEVGVKLVFHPAFAPDPGGDRKALAGRCEAAVRSGHTAATGANLCA